MPYGTIKVDTITFTDAGVDKSVTISGLVQNPTFTGNVTATGTISGLIVQAPTVTGTTANFASGVYTTQISGAIVKVPAGTAGAPSIQVGVGASVAPGLYGAGADLLGISTGGAGRIFIDSTGRLGVGTSSPLKELQINATTPTIRLEDNGGGSKRLEISIDSSALARIDATQSASQLSFGTVGTERLRIDSSGRVGIGTSSPYGQFAVVGEDSNGVIASFDAGTNYQSFMLLGTTDAGNGTIAIQPRTVPGSGTADFYTYFKNITAGAGTTRHNVIIDGNVGIGTTSPAKLLHIQSGSVSGAARGGSFTKTLFESSDATTSYWEFQAASTATNDILFSKSNTGAYGIVGYDNVNNALRFHSNSAERLRIDSSGRLLVGTSSVPGTAGAAPYARLQIEGNTFSGTGPGSIALRMGTAPTSIVAGSEIGQIAFAANNNGEFARIDCLADGTAGTNDYPGRLVFSTTADGAATPTERMRIDSSGNVGIGTSSPATILDCKGNITLGAQNSALANIQPTTASGTNIAGTHLTLRAGIPTGSGASGQVQIYPSTSSATGGTSPASSGDKGLFLRQQITNWDSNPGLYMLNAVFGLSASEGHQSGLGNDGTVVTIDGANNGSQSALEIVGSSNGSSATQGFIRFFGSSAKNPYVTIAAQTPGTSYTSGNFIINTYNAGVEGTVATFTNTGRVGIGTTNPGTRLHVDTITDATAITVAASTSTVGQILLGTGVKTASFQGIISTGNGFDIGTTLGAPVIFYTNNTERLRIDSSGRLLVGTSSWSGSSSNAGGIEIYSSNYVAGGQVTEKLGSWRASASDNNGSADVGIDYYRMPRGGGIQSGTEIRFFTGYSYLGGTFQRMVIDQNGTITFNAYGAGTLSTNASGVISASDGRYKTKTRQLDNSLDVIAALKPTYYKWNEGSPFASEHEELGFVAQEVAAVIPEASPGEDEEGKYRNYHDRAIIAMLVRGMQEQQAMIAALNSRVAFLEGA